MNTEEKRPWQAPQKPRTKFALGEVVTTPGALEVVTPAELAEALARHASGDWGEVNDDDWEENGLSLDEGRRLVSVYRTKQEETFYVITEADRSATTVLLPDEY